MTKNLEKERAAAEAAKKVAATRAAAAKTAEEERHAAKVDKLSEAAMKPGEPSLLHDRSSRRRAGKVRQPTKQQWQFCEQRLLQ